ncbi:hypothetical protein EVG20_g10200, partial [Dentipellis fragilis]
MYPSWRPGKISAERWISATGGSQAPVASSGGRDPHTISIRLAYVAWCFCRALACRCDASAASLSCPAIVLDVPADARRAWAARHSSARIRSQSNHTAANPPHLTTLALRPQGLILDHRLDPCLHLLASSSGRGTHPPRTGTFAATNSNRAPGAWTCSAQRYPIPCSQVADSDDSMFNIQDSSLGCQVVIESHHAQFWTVV